MPQMPVKYRNRLRELVVDLLHECADESGALPKNEPSSFNGVIDALISDPEFMSTYGHRVISHDLNKRIEDIYAGSTDSWGMGPRTIIGSPAHAAEQIRAQRRRKALMIAEQEGFRLFGRNKEDGLTRVREIEAELAKES